uniref:Uncharacterized protein n=1 Tax=Hyaloperonospora arabidopsidis (strain Emoy2) TaxID=559515 RepID=M4B2K8_HYAAE
MDSGSPISLWTRACSAAPSLASGYVVTTAVAVGLWFVTDVRVAAPSSYTRYVDAQAQAQAQVIKAARGSLQPHKGRVSLTLSWFLYRCLRAGDQSEATGRGGLPCVRCVHPSDRRDARAKCESTVGQTRGSCIQVSRCEWRSAAEGAGESCPAGARQSRQSHGHDRGSIQVPYRGGIVWLT